MRRRSAISQLLASVPGRLGLGLLAALTLLSLYVVATYPLDFGPARWSNPAVWSDNPSAVPPAWTNLLSRERRPVHRHNDAEGAGRDREAGQLVAALRRHKVDPVLQVFKQALFDDVNVRPVWFRIHPFGLVVGSDQVSPIEASAAPGQGAAVAIHERRRPRPGCRPRPWPPWTAPHSRTGC